MRSFLGLKTCLLHPCGPSRCRRKFHPKDRMEETSLNSKKPFYTFATKHFWNHIISFYLFNTPTTFEKSKVLMTISFSCYQFLVSTGQDFKVNLRRNFFSIKPFYISFKNLFDRRNIYRITFSPKKINLLFLNLQSSWGLMLDPTLSVMLNLKLLQRISVLQISLEREGLGQSIR